MNPLSLNLVAITVFLFTAIALIGPAVHLPASFPAIVAFGLLGLAAIDTLSWSGQGAALLLDGIAGLSPEHRHRVVRHEAGHFLAAYLLEIPVTGYTLTAWECLRQGQGGQGGMIFDTQELERELQAGQLSGQLLDRYCTIWMAGAAAEFLQYDNIQGGADDRQKLRGVLTQLGLSPEARSTKERLASLRAKELLQAHASAFETLVEALEQRQSVLRCYEILTTAIAPGPAAPNPSAPTSVPTNPAPTPPTP